MCLPLPRRFVYQEGLFPWKVCLPRRCVYLEGLFTQKVCLPGRCIYLEGLQQIYLQIDPIVLVPPGDGRALPPGGDVPVHGVLVHTDSQQRNYKCSLIFSCFLDLFWLLLVYVCKFKLKQLFQTLNKFRNMFRKPVFTHYKGSRDIACIPQGRGSW